MLWCISQLVVGRSGICVNCGCAVLGHEFANVELSMLTRIEFWNNGLCLVTSRFFVAPGFQFLLSKTCSSGAYCIILNINAYISLSVSTE